MRMRTVRFAARLAVIFAICLVAGSSFAPRAGADDCSGPLNLDDPPCVPCQSTTIRITDESGYCYASGHYEDSCTHEVTGYWFWMC